MKIYIVGSVASGKSTLAKQISEKTGIDFYELDGVVHEPDKNSPWGNRKRPIEERDKIFYSIIKRDSWVIEDTGRPCFEEGLKQADKIIFIEISTRIRNKRIIFRWFKQKLGIEKCIYKPSFNMLKCMMQWSKDYDLGKDKLKDRILPYQSKIKSLKNNKDITEFLCNFNSDKRN